MKNIRTIVILFFGFWAGEGNGAITLWASRAADVEFAVVADGGSGPTEVVSTLETGYDGSWYFGISPYFGLGQTFVVPSAGTLSFLRLRIGGLSAVPASGHFKLSVFEFHAGDPMASIPLASMLGNAADFALYPLSGTPVTPFDFRAADVGLETGKTYAWTIEPEWDYAGGPLVLQSAKTDYPGGRLFALDGVLDPPPAPEPGTPLLLLAAAGWVLRRGR
jgi:hypothetical protein